MLVVRALLSTRAFEIIRGVAEEGTIRLSHVSRVCGMLERGKILCDLDDYR